MSFEGPGGRQVGVSVQSDRQISWCVPGRIAEVRDLCCAFFLERKMMYQQLPKKDSHGTNGIFTYMDGWFCYDKL